MLVKVQVFHTQLYLLLVFTTCLTNGALSPPKVEPRKDYARNLPLLHALEDLEVLIYKFFQRFSEEMKVNAYTFPFKPEISSTATTDLIKSYLKDYEETTVKLKREYESDWNKNGSYKVGWNPLAKMRMINRLVHTAPVILQALSNDSSPVVHEESFLDSASVIKDFMTSRNMTFPSEIDYSDVISAILKIQETYWLKTKDISDGVLLRTDTRIKLRGVDCVDIGNYALKSRYYALSLYWLRHAITKLRKEQGSPHDMRLALSLLEDAIKQHDDKFDYVDPKFLVYKVGDNLDGAIDKQEEMIEKYQEDLNQGWDMWSKFNALCMAGSSQSASRKADLFCWYETKLTHYLLIHPAKAELLSKTPVIVRYHEIVGKSTIQFLREAATRGLRPSLVVDNGNETDGAEIKTTNLKSDDRTSMDTFLSQEEYPELRLLNAQLESVSGFHLGNGPDDRSLNVVSYTVGTFYYMHMDALEIPPWHEHGGDRIATFVLYLSDVEMGGGTPFLFPGISAEPMEGSAVFWYNIDTAGYPDTRTFHAGCPVVLGEKWIGNKWVRMGEQFRTYPCEKGRKWFQFYVNGKLLDSPDLLL